MRCLRNLPRICSYSHGSSTQDPKDLGVVHAQRERASQLVRGMEAFYDSATFVMTWGDKGHLGEGSLSAHYMGANLVW